MTDTTYEFDQASKDVAGQLEGGKVDDRGLVSLAVAAERYRAKAVREELNGLLGSSARDSKSIDKIQALTGELRRLQNADCRLDSEEGVGDLASEAFHAALNAAPNAHSTGIDFLDHFGCNFAPGKISSFSAETGVGKSLVSTYAAMGFTLRSGEHVLIFSMEMPAAEISARLTAALSHTKDPSDQAVRMRELQHPRKFYAERLGAESQENRAVAVRAAFDEANELKVVINDSPNLSVAQIRDQTMKAKAMIEAKGGTLGLVIVDTLGRLKIHGKDYRIGLDNACYELEALARDENLHVCILAQLNRQGEIRDTAALKHVCYWQVEIEREKGAQLGTLHIKKNRGDGLGQSQEYEFLGQHQVIIETSSADGYASLESELDAPGIHELQGEMF